MFKLKPAAADMSVSVCLQTRVSLSLQILGVMKSLKVSELKPVLSNSFKNIYFKNLNNYIMPEYFIMNLLFKTDILRFLNQNIKYIWLHWNSNWTCWLEQTVLNRNDALRWNMELKARADDSKPEWRIAASLWSKCSLHFSVVIKQQWVNSNITEPCLSK